MKQRMTTLNGKTDKMEKVRLVAASVVAGVKWVDLWLYNCHESLNLWIFQGVDPDEDPLKWIEENIPESAETENPLPVIDSDEEIETVI